MSALGWFRVKGCEWGGEGSHPGVLEEGEHSFLDKDTTLWSQSPIQSPIKNQPEGALGKGRRGQETDRGGVGGACSAVTVNVRHLHFRKR